MFRFTREVISILTCAASGLGLGCAATAPGLDEAKEEPAEERDDSKSYSDAIADTEKSEGFLTLHRSEDHFYFELPEEIFERDLCLSAQIVGAIGDWRVRGSELGSDVVRFRKQGESVALAKRNLWFRAEPDSPIHAAVSSTFSDSPIVTTSAVATNPDTEATLVNLVDLFDGSAYQMMGSSSGFKREGSPTILAVHNNPENLTVRVAYRMTRTPRDPSESGSGGRQRNYGRLADSRNLEITVQYDLFRLPDNDYRPRPTDDRLGVWGQQYKDYTGIEDRDTAFRYRAIRWNVEKSDPAATVSPAKEPITFYVDRSVPAEFRSLIREGTLWWNEAFEAVGISDAIVVEDQPDEADWHPTDIRYSMIYWNLSDGLNFSGLAGPSLTDPVTGQVFKANAYLNAEFPSFSRYRYLLYTWWRGPTRGELAARDPFEAAAESWWDAAERLASKRSTGSRLCSYDASFSSQLAFARLVLQHRGHLKPGSEEQDRYAREAFRQLVAHEIGHALGFGHNFKASRLNPYDDILSGAAGSEITGSIMDYNPINLPPRGQEPGPYFMAHLGPYDRLAVEYLYRPFHGLSPDEEAAALDAIAARAETRPGLAFDNGLLSGSDPTSNTDDLGDDPIRFAEDRLAMIDEILPHLPDLVLAEGHEYNAIRQALDAAIVSVSMDYFDMAARTIGGREILRLHHHSPAEDHAGEVTPIRPLSASAQRAALDLIERRLFADDAYEISPRFLNLLQSDLKYDWNYPYRYGSDYRYESRLDYLYGTTLATILAPDRLGRVKDNESRLAEGEEAFTLPELLGRLTGSVFQNLENGNVSAAGEYSALVASKRRSLQRIYVGLLTDLALSTREGTPRDAQALATAELEEIRVRLRKVSTRGFDDYGRAHVLDLERRIGRVLEASLELPASG